jgi:hypothetical protein
MLPQYLARLPSVFHLAGAMRGRLSVLVLAAAAIALPASAARADSIDLTTCSTSALGQPFMPWADVARYELSPGGDFEQPSWALNGGAQRAPGSEPYAATGKVGTWSLTLPAGSSAQSPPSCVDPRYPTVRFFIAGTGSVAVSLVYGSITVPAGIAVAGSAWFPSPIVVSASPVVATASGGTAQASVRLTGVSGNPRVDDVFIDPWNRG